jgi:hypothetical protein
MEAIKAEINVRGRWVPADAVRILDRVLVIRGKWIKVASLREELYEDVENPSALIAELKRGKVRADIFSFWQRLPEIKPKYSFYFEWDNFAAIRVTTYETWLEKQIDGNARRAVKRAPKRELTVTVVKPDGEFINGIVSIFNETPIRQGKKFWHYGKTYYDVKKEIIERDFDVAEFLGAYYEGRLIGFVKIIYTRGYANFAQILSMIAHRDKYPTNALIAKAVELCAEKKIPYLVYERFVYGQKGSDSLSDFKRRNGFEKIDVPRYYIPLSVKGKIVLKMKVHHGIIGIVPRKVLNRIIDLRRRMYERKYASN